MILFSGKSTLVEANEQLTGKSIAQKVFDRYRGENSISKATMILEDKEGYQRTRIFIIKRILVDGLEKRLLKFLSPANIKETGFLTIERDGYETDQFLYLPALRRSRRVVSSQKFHKFVNSDFTYEDMERHPVEDYIYTVKGEKIMDNIDCYVLETRPQKVVTSQYSYIISYIAKESFMILFSKYYDRKGIHTKTYKVLKLEKKQDIWTETKIIMEDVKNNHKTYINVSHIEHNTDMKPDQISKTALEND